MRSQTSSADPSHDVDATDAGAAASGESDGATADATGARPEADSLDTDTVHHLLQNERRRNVLRYLRDAEDPVQMRDIAEQVAAWEHDTTVEQLMSDQRQRVYIGLYQSHLPKFDNAGVIDYEQNRGIVETRPAAAELMPYLDDESEGDGEGTDERDGGEGQSAGNERGDSEPDTDGSHSETVGSEPDTDGGTPWERYYLGASGGGALALASAGFGVPFGGPSGFVVAALLLAVFAGLSAAQVAASRE